MQGRWRSILVTFGLTGWTDGLESWWCLESWWWWRFNLDVITWRYADINAYCRISDRKHCLLLEFKIFPKTIQKFSIRKIISLYWIVNWTNFSFIAKSSTVAAKAFLHFMIPWQILEMIWPRGGVGEPWNKKFSNGSRCNHMVESWNQTGFLPHMFRLKFNRWTWQVSGFHLRYDL